MTNSACHRRDAREPDRQDRERRQQPDPRSVGQCEENPDGKQCHIAASRKREEGRRHPNQEKGGARPSVTDLLRVDEDRRRHGDERDDEKHKRVARFVDDHRGGAGEIEGVVTDGLQDNIGVGNADSDCGYRKPEEDQPCLSPAADNEGDDEEESDRLQEICSIKPKSCSVIRSNDDGNGAGDNEQGGGYRDRGPPLRHDPTAPGFNDKNADRDEDARFEKCCRQRTGIAPPDRIPGKQRAGKRSARQGKSILSGARGRRVVYGGWLSGCAH